MRRLPSDPEEPLSQASLVREMDSRPQLEDLNLEPTALAVYRVQEGPFVPEAALLEVCRDRFEMGRRQLVSQIYLQGRRRAALRRGPDNDIIGLVEFAERDRVPEVYRREGLEAHLERPEEHLLGPDFFEAKVVPRVAAMARNAQEFDQLCLLAQGAVEDLLHLAFKKDDLNPNPGVVDAFFQSGQFERWLRSGGAEGVRAAAMYFSAGESYKHSAECEELSLPADLVPEEHAALFFKAIRACALNGREQTRKFIQSVPLMRAAFTAEGRDDAFRTWLYFLGLMGHNSSYYTPEYFFSDAKRLIVELDAYAAWCARVPNFAAYVESYFMDEDHAVFCFTNKSGETYKNIANPLAELAGSGVDDATLDEILRKTLEAGLPSMVMMRPVEEYTTAEAVFPGGYDGLLAYCKSINGAWAGISHLCSQLGRPKFTASQWELYLRKGKEMVDRYGESADRYFYNLYLFRDKPELLDRKGFSEAMDLLADTVEPLSKHPYLIASHPVSSIIDAGMDRWVESDEVFDSFIRGLRLIAAEPISEDGEDRDEFNAWIGYWLYPLQTFQLNHFKKLTVVLDWEKFAQTMLSRRAGGATHWEFAGCLDALPHVLKCDAKLTITEEMGASSDLKDAYAAYNVFTKSVRDDEAEPSEATLETHRQALLSVVQALGLEEKEFNWEGLRKEYDDALKARLLGRFTNRVLAIVRPEPVISASSYFQEAGAATQMAVMGGTLLHAFGFIKDPYINGDLAGHLPGTPALLLGEAGEEGLKEDWVAALQARIAVIMPRVEGQIQATALRNVGRPPVGGKAHSPSTVDPDRFHILNRLFGFSQTPFAMMHHNSVLLPPATTSLHMFYAAQLLKMMGIPIETYQVGGQGHWPQEVCEVVAATYLLGGSHPVSYAAGAFRTTHDKTGARYMAYGDGVLNRELPYSLDIPKDEDRTDVLAQPHPDSFALGHLVDALVTSALYEGGHFREEGRAFLADARRLLHENGLAQVVASTGWVARTATDKVENHEAVVRVLTDRWAHEVGRPGNGLVGDFRKMLVGHAGRLEAKREEVIAADPGMFERFMRF